jgi:hypothetical protein
VVPFQNCVRQRRPVSKMAAITKNRNFFKWPKLIYFIGKSSKFIKNPVIYVKKLIIMLIQFKFGHFLAENRAVLAI